jgi:gliding motility-associated-like protein
MKKPTLILLLLIVIKSFTQTTAERYTIGSGGGSVTAGNTLYMYDVGGLVVNTTNTNSGKTYTQGFEQPSRLIFITDFTPPNAFSPNDDGINDLWIIPLPSSSTNSFNVTIFNRWGDRVAYIENYNNIDKVWDGTYYGSGSPVTDGTYFYVIETTQGQTISNGWIQVIR